MKYQKLLLLMAACLLPFMIFIVSGLSVFLTNINEIEFSFRNVALPLTLTFVFFTLLIFSILLIARRSDKWLKVCLASLFAISLSVWVQSQFFAWNFGPFNGNLIGWYKWRPKMILELAVWLTILVLSFRLIFRGKKSLIHSFFTGLLILGLISTLINYVHSPACKKMEDDESMYSGIFDFHPDKNVLIILLDDFQSDYFNQILKSHPSELSDLDGFTFYRNTTSSFPTTRTSLPSVITGEPYRNNKPYDDYISESASKYSMTGAYEAKGYSTRFVSQLQGLFPGVLSMENVGYGMTNLNFHIFFEYLDYAFFRAFPIVAKRVIYKNGDWLLSSLSNGMYPAGRHGSDLIFLNLFETRAGINRQLKGTFKFLHFFTPHAPYRINENLEYDGNMQGSEGYLRQCRAAIKIASRLLTKIKCLGIYDQADIFILSDHGTGEFPPINSGNPYTTAVRSVPSAIQSSSMALMLHKPPRSRGNILISDLPMQLTDVSCMLGLPCNDSLCMGYHQAIDGKPRLRSFYHYEWLDEFWNQDVVPPITEYFINGHSYDPTAFTTGKYRYTSGGRQDIPTVPPPDYKIGDTIDFTLKGNNKSDAYTRIGWSDKENDQRWTNGKYVGLTFHLNRVPAGDLKIKLLGFAYLANNKLSCQTVTIAANEESLGRWLVRGGEWYEAVVPVRLVRSDKLNVVFNISNPISPMVAENAGDSRDLGLAVIRMVIEECGINQNMN